MTHKVFHLQVCHEDGEVPGPVADYDVASSHPAHFGRQI
jgi:hypothetical protein